MPVTDYLFRILGNVLGPVGIFEAAQGIGEMAGETRTRVDLQQEGAENAPIREVPDLEEVFVEDPYLYECLQDELCGGDW